MVTEDDVRRIALSLPATAEKPSYERPGFRVKDKLFARIREEGDILVLWCESIEEKEALIASDPALPASRTGRQADATQGGRAGSGGGFLTLPHYDGHPLVLVRFGAVDADELTELPTDSWRLRAPVRLRNQFDAEHGF